MIRMKIRGKVFLRHRSLDFLNSFSELFPHHLSRIRMNRSKTGSAYRTTLVVPPTLTLYKEE